jgi:hypothetical protein
MRIKEPAFKIGDRVAKRQGYLFPGYIVAVFYTTNSKLRYVVEAASPDFSGMLHIFNEDQLELRR